MDKKQTGVSIWGKKDAAKEEKPAAKDAKTKTSKSKSKSRSRQRPAEKVEKVEKAEVKQKREYYADKIRKHNVMIVRKNTLFKTLVVTAKNLLKKQFDTIELHAVDEASYLTITLVAQCLMKYKYVTLSRIKTKTVQTLEVEEKKEGDVDHFTRLQPRLVMHLTKTKEFDSIYDDFESQFKKMVEEHKEDIEDSEAQVDDQIDPEEVKIQLQN